MAKIVDRYFLVDPWKVIEEGFDPSHGRVAESIFSLANEFMGVRGYFEEGYSGDHMRGSYVNAVFADHIDVQFHFKGLVSRECFVVNSVDWLYTRIILDEEQLDLAKCKFSDFKRVLDMKTGILTREFIWETNSGKKLALVFTRFTSMDTPNLGCQRIEFKALNFTGDIEIVSCLDFNTIHEGAGRNFWDILNKDNRDFGSEIHAFTEKSGQQLHAAFKLNLPANTQTSPVSVEDEKLIGKKFTLSLKQNESVFFDKIVSVYAERKRGICEEEVRKQGKLCADKILDIAFDKAMDAHIKSWAETWKTLDIVIDGDPENQQGFRFCVFSLHQTYHGYDSTLNVGGKGLTGESYGGRTWWDTESYILPFYLFNNPKAARQLMEYRYNHLPMARDRAIEMDCEGACYPMSTIDGTECCNWWSHGNIEIHVSAIIPYGIWHYVNVTDDKEFLYTHGIEILLESSRYFASRGQWSQKTGEFGFYGVMGPDEFHMMVNNNCYTNVLAKKIFNNAIKVINEMKECRPEVINALMEKIGVTDENIAEWQKMADNMRIPYNKETDIYEQNDGFFDYPHIDVKNIPHTMFPIYHHWSYDSIFRYDMIKQPDVLLLPFFFSTEYSMETKRLNYEYYEPRCSHESSLSPCIHSILASELGKHDEAHEYAGFASRLDLDDYNRNTREGLHVTSLAGAWLNIVYGFGGLRSDGAKLAFYPSIPKGWNSFSFNILYRGSRLNITISRKSAIFKVTEGSPVPVIVFEKEYTADEKGVEIDMPADRLG